MIYNYSFDNDIHSLDLNRLVDVCLGTPIWCVSVIGFKQDLRKQAHKGLATFMVEW